MQLTMLGTGNAMVTECYNTCFVLQEDQQYFMVDAGGGNGILSQLKKAGIDWKDIKNIFITHKHIDHLLGMVWMVRAICQSMKQETYPGEVSIYAHTEVIEILNTIIQMVLQKKDLEFVGKRVHFITVEDGETRKIIGHPVTFFDIHSTKAKQYGFSMELGENKKLTCCGDEPFNESERAYVEGCTWLLHEAFCLASQADIFKPYEKHHSTVKDACQLAEQFQIPNVILYHTEDRNIRNRKEWYEKEGREVYHGKLFIPEDLEVIAL